jgi:hypothetical protein
MGKVKKAKLRYGPVVTIHDHNVDEKYLLTYGTKSQYFH